MPITITQRPSYYNLVVSPNVYTLSGLGSSEDAYVLEVSTYDGGTAVYTPIATVQQPPNPAGVAMFDISKILQSYMDIQFVETTQLTVPSEGQTVEYAVRIGTSTGGIITYQPGYDARRICFNGYLPWREINWPDQNEFLYSLSALPCETGPGNQVLTKTSRYLHNYPETTIPVRSSVYHTLSYSNRPTNWDSGTNFEMNAQPYAVRIQYYDVGDQLIQTAAYVLAINEGSIGPRVDYDDAIIGLASTGQLVGNIGSGPQNLKDAGLWPQSSSAIWNLVTQVWGNYQVIWNLASSDALVDHYIVDVMSIDQCKVNSEGMPASPDAADIIPYLDLVLYSQIFQVADQCSGYDPITVSFVNQYGVKDYYTFDRRNTYNQAINRNNYDQQLGSWSASTFEISQHGRGRRTFSTQIETNMTMSSYWMSDEESEWLEELFTSPHIQVYYNGVWEPAVITSNTYEQKTNTRNGLFQHTLNVQFANNKKVQRG